MFGIDFNSWLPPVWADFLNSLSLTDLIAGIPAFLVIYTVLPSAIYTARHRSRKGNWYIPPEPTDESPSTKAKLLLLNSLAVLFTIKYIAEYVFGHPNPEIFVTGALLTVVLITVVIYHFENIGIIKPAIPLSVLWGTTTLTTLYYTTSTHDITHEIYLVSSLLMFLLEWASPRSSYTQKAKPKPKSFTDVNHKKSE
ncbi:14691_t:CDS:2 [Acaulospora morrowiae]|uniref:14691_t:CDS:1 n=1 Tax=Acaulospora morrowiae TaxID=94023 RepID=A0A9N8W8L9_9GLOM|nr:14691_t:CDS:2 [Acaulospora morrowiae]